MREGEHHLHLAPALPHITEGPREGKHFLEGEQVIVTPCPLGHKRRHKADGSQYERRRINEHHA